MGYYNRGLEEYHLEYLRCIYQNAKSTWYSIATISSFLEDDKDNVEKIVEPLLIKEGLISKGSQGRKITNKGLAYLNKLKI
jgi:Holliday junction DNA helicase RuvB